MSLTETAWAFAPLSVALVVLYVFSRRRRKTIDYAESKSVKTDLPVWVKNVELLNFGVALAVTVMGTIKLFRVIWGVSRTADEFTGVSAVYVTLGVFGIAMPLASLWTNSVSWVVPILRKENQRAFRGHQVSFKSANLGLIKLAYVSVPIGAICLWVAAMSPWK